MSLQADYGNTKPRKIGEAYQKPKRKKSLQCAFLTGGTDDKGRLKTCGWRSYTLDAQKKHYAETHSKAPKMEQRNLKQMGLKVEE